MQPYLRRADQQERDKAVLLVPNKGRGVGLEERAKLGTRVDQANLPRTRRSGGPFRGLQA